MAVNGRQIVIYSFREENERTLQHEIEGEIRTIAYSSDARLLAAGGSTGVRICDLHSDEMYVLEPLSHGSSSVEFSPDNKRLASAGIDGSILIWDTDSRTIVAALKISTQRVWSIAFSPDGESLASGHQDGTVNLWNLLTLEPRTLARHSDEVRCVAFSPDGAILASGSRDDTAILWDVESCREIEMLKGHSHNVESLTFWADEQEQELKLVTGSPDSTVKLWTVKRLQPDLQFLPSGIGSLALRPDGKILVARQRNCRDITIWDLEAGSFRTISVDTDGVISAVGISQQYLAIGTKDEIRVFCTENAMEQTGLSPRNAEGEVIVLAFSPDGTSLASGNKDGRVMAWDVSSTKPRFACTEHSLTVTDICFTPDGKSLASGSLDGKVIIRNARTGSCINKIDASRDDVTCVAFSIDGKILASAGADDTTALWYEWRHPKNAPDVTLSGHSDVIYGIRFLPDGRSLISASGDKTLRIWDICDGQQRFVLTGHTSSVESVDLPRGANLVASGDRDGTVRLWRATSDEEVKATPW